MDLVAYTPLTEGWDAEDVRELLTGYFEMANTIVVRYGGIVEKFIGDAVVAAWGSQESREDDAARCVRAGLEIVDGVAGYGEGRRLSGMRARAGVVTGHVASWRGVNQGLVAGDKVNLAARVQATADPGTVFVDGDTMRATRSTIAYADAGERVLKGVAEPQRLWSAVRVVAAAGGAQRTDGLEASFVGRARELALVKELFHATREAARARLVAVSGVAGIGKSRLSWEFEKYVKGLADEVFWHRGRCLSYGDGVAFWALAEIVRARFGIADDDAPEAAASKLAAGLSQWVPDPHEREFVAPRLGVLVGMVDRELSRDDLFAGWRLFLERLASSQPVVLVFEDLQWADSGLLDFLEYLLDWSSALPIFLFTLARPELSERRPGWLADRRNATVLHLEPLPDSAIGQLLAELVPGMPSSIEARITAYAGGIPLYAVETIRSLIDKDLVVHRDGVYHIEQDIDDLDVPASLTAVIAARIDGLPPDERDLVKGLSVLGATFSRRAVAAVCGASDEQADEWLRTLVRREVLSVHSDARSAERDEYAFVQAMLRSAAYGTLSRRERKTRHKAVADYLRSAFPDDGFEVAEVIANHLLDAFTATGTDPESEELRAAAESAFERAGERAGAIGSPGAAEGYYRTAGQLAKDEFERTGHLENAAYMAERAGRPNEALALIEAAMAAHRQAGRDVSAARLVTDWGWMRLNFVGQHEATLERLTEALELLEREGAADALPMLNVVIGGTLATLGLDQVRAAEHLERALVGAAALEDHGALLAGMHTRAGLLIWEHRLAEAKALLVAVTELSQSSHDIEMEAMARDSLGYLLAQADATDATAQLESSLALSNRFGHAPFQAETAMRLGLRHFFLGHWDDTERYARLAVELSQSARLPDGRLVLIVVQAARGELAEAEQELAALEGLTDPDDPDRVGSLDVARAVVAFARRRWERTRSAAAGVAEQVFRTRGMLSEEFRLAWPLAVEAALSAGRADQAAGHLALVAEAPKGHVTPYLRAQLARLQGLVESAGGDVAAAEVNLRSAAEQFGELGYPYWLARARVDLAGCLAELGRTSEVTRLLRDAAAAYADLRAQPDLEHVRSLLPADSPPSGP